MLYEVITLRISILFLVVIAVSSVITAVHLDDNYKNDTRAALLKNAKVIESVLIKYGLDDQAVLLNSIDQIRNMRITLIDDRGVVVITSYSIHYTKLYD